MVKGWSFLGLHICQCSVPRIPQPLSFRVCVQAWHTKTHGNLCDCGLSTHAFAPSCTTSKVENRTWILDCMKRKSPFSFQLRILYFSLLEPVLGSAGTFSLPMPFPSLDYGDFLEAGHNEACFNPGPATQQLCYLTGPQLPLAQFLHHLT